MRCSRRTADGKPRGLVLQKLATILSHVQAPTPRQMIHCLRDGHLQQLCALVVKPVLCSGLMRDHERRAHVGRITLGIVVLSVWLCWQGR